MYVVNLRLSRFLGPLILKYLIILASIFSLSLIFILFIVYGMRIYLVLKEIDRFIISRCVFVWLFFYVIYIFPYSVFLFPIVFQLFN